MVAESHSMRMVSNLHYELLQPARLTGNPAEDGQD
jgi:hypothetical protein